MDPVVIIGTGLAGYTLARELRGVDGEVAITLITADDVSFYAKPNLSNALRQGKDAQGLVNVESGAMAERLGVEIVTGTRIESIDPGARELVTDQGRYPYSRLVLANGATPIHIPVEGSGRDALMAVNNLDDYRRFRERLEGGRHVTIMGPGLIGCEFANDLVAEGYQVSVVGPDPYPVSTLLPEVLGEALQGGLGEMGVEWHLGETVAAVDKGGRYRVTISDGAAFETDIVLSAVGLRSDTTLAGAAGIAVNRGVMTNEYLETNHPDVYALGDCAEVNGLNLPFVMPLMAGARALAKTLAGERSAVLYPPMPVVIKTTACPLVVLPPPRGVEGEWRVEGEGGDLRALHYDIAGRLTGFALSGACCAEKDTLVGKIAL